MQIRACHVVPELEGSPGGRGSFRSHRAQEVLEIKQVDEVRGAGAEKGALPHHPPTGNRGRETEKG